MTHQIPPRDPSIDPLLDPTQRDHAVDPDLARADLNRPDPDLRGVPASGLGTPDTHVERTDVEEGDANRDPITGEPGSHPVGTTTGAAAMGGLATMAGLGIGGPIGGAVGALLGTAVGAALGHNAAEAVNPTFEDIEPELRDTFATRPYAGESRYEDYQGAYAFGTSERVRLRDAQWDDTVESDLRTRWEASPDNNQLRWEDARGPVRDAWDTTDRRFASDKARAERDLDIER